MFQESMWSIQIILQALNDSSSYMLTKRKWDHLKKEKEWREKRSDEDVWEDDWAERTKEEEKEHEKWKMNDWLYSALRICTNVMT